MYPILFEIYGFGFSSWYALFSMALITAYLYSNSISKKKYPELNQKIDELFIWVYFAGFLGARWFSIILEREYEEVRFDLLSSAFSLGNMTLYGGLLAGFLVGYILLKRWKLSFGRASDLLVPAIFLGIAIGRIGCLLNGDDYGRAIEIQELPAVWAIQIPALNDGVYRYPVQLMESVPCLLIFLFLHHLNLKRNLRQGYVTQLAIVLYCLLRALTETFRGDFRGEPVLNYLSPAQFISLVLITLVVIRVGCLKFMKAQ